MLLTDPVSVGHKVEHHAGGNENGTERKEIWLLQIETRSAVADALRWGTMEWRWC
jgi:hypothetical protein